MIVSWSGAEGGLGNRMLGIASALALSKILNSEITFTWNNNRNCPAEYADLFKAMPGLHVNNNPKDKLIQVKTSGWDPINIFEGFKTQIDNDLDLENFLFEFIRSLKDLPFSDYVKQQFLNWKKNLIVKTNLAIHIRRTDRIEHHKYLYKKIFSKQFLYIIRSTGLIKSLQYTFFSPDYLKSIENNSMKKLLNQYLSDKPGITYSLYCDSFEDLIQTEKEFNNISYSLCYYPSYCSINRDEIWGQFGVRKTQIQDALIDLLCMSASTWIAQNNSASSFSLVASIIGGTPIVTRQPTHNFWKKIIKIFDKKPYDILI